MTDELKLCAYCGKKLPPRQRKYCNEECQQRYLREGPARERFNYAQNNEPSLTELAELIKTGVWFCFTADHADEQCIGDFIRIFHRAPEHVIWLPSSPTMKWVGPVWSDEELAHRWNGWEDAKEEQRVKLEKRREARRTDPRYST